MGPAIQTSSEPIVFSRDEQIECLSPRVGRTISRMPRWKYEALRRAVLRSAIAAGSRGATQADMVEASSRHLAELKIADIGSISWHVTTVKLDLEARGELVRVAGATPLRHVRAAPEA